MFVIMCQSRCSNNKGSTFSVFEGVWGGWGSRLLVVQGVRMFLIMCQARQ